MTKPKTLAETALASVPERRAPPFLPAPAATPAALAAADDVQAISQWLIARGGRSPHTFHSYRREAHRLLLWMGEQGLTLRQMKVEHVHLFLQHLAAPPSHWLRPRKPRRGEALCPTQMMVGPSSASAREYSRRVLAQAMGFLRAAGYVQVNPFELVARGAGDVLAHTDPTSRTGVLTLSSAAPAAPSGAASIASAEAATSHREHHLDTQAWDWMWAWICAMPRDTPAQSAQASRVRWLFALGYHTGLRRSEIAQGVMGNFRRGASGWSLLVIGKGDKPRHVTVSSALADEMRRYRTAIGLLPWPAPSETLPLVASVSRGRLDRPLTPRMIGRLVQETGRAAARACDDPHVAERLGRITTHWLRHTFVTHRLQAGAALEATQAEAGHASITTTMIYRHLDDAERRRDAELLAEFGLQGRS